jgi:hypothetical protein
MRRRAVVGAGIAAGVAAHHARKKTEAQYQDQGQYQDEAPDEQAAVEAQQTQQQSVPSAGGLDSGQMDQLKQLADLRDQGVLTEEEFAEQKSRILG